PGEEVVDLLLDLDAPRREDLLGRRELQLDEGVAEPRAGRLLALEGGVELLAGDGPAADEGVAEAERPLGSLDVNAALVEVECLLRAGLLRNPEGSAMAARVEELEELVEAECLDATSKPHPSTHAGAATGSPASRHAPHAWFGPYETVPDAVERPPSQ